MTAKVRMSISASCYPYSAWKCSGACSRQNIWMTMPKNWLIVGINNLAS